MSELAKDTAIHLADTGYIQLMTNASLKDANGVALPNAIVNLYVGMTGNTTGEFGQFASLVAEVNDANGNTKYGAQAGSASRRTSRGTQCSRISFRRGWRTARMSSSAGSALAIRARLSREPDLL